MCLAGIAAGLARGLASGGFLLFAVRPSISVSMRHENRNHKGQAMAMASDHAVTCSMVAYFSARLRAGIREYVRHNHLY